MSNLQVQTVHVLTFQLTTCGNVATATEKHSVGAAAPAKPALQCREPVSITTAVLQSASIMTSWITVCNVVHYAGVDKYSTYTGKETACNLTFTNNSSISWWRNNAHLALREAQRWHYGHIKYNLFRARILSPRYAIELRGCWPVVLFDTTITMCAQ